MTLYNQDGVKIEDSAWKIEFRSDRKIDENDKEYLSKFPNRNEPFYIVLDLQKLPEGTTAISEIHFDYYEEHIKVETEVYQGKVTQVSPQWKYVMTDWKRVQVGVGSLGQPLFQMQYKYSLKPIKMTRVSAQRVVLITGIEKDSIISTVSVPAIPPTYQLPTYIPIWPDWPDYPSYPDFPETDLTFTIAGIVWEDEKTGKESNFDGLIGTANSGNQEAGIANVEVKLYEYGTSNVIMSTYTNEEGRYVFNEIPVGTYDVGFVYDGMTYKATQSFAGGSVSDYKSNPNDEKYKYTSKVDEDILERQAFNNKFYEITENGVAKNSSGIQTNIEKLEYKTENGVSKIQTTYADGKVKKDFQFEAKTSTALKVGYPLFNEVNNADSGKNIDGQSYFENYPYMTWVNLGLQQRPKVDFALLKDVATSTVTINQKKIDYEYNTRLNLLAYNESGYDIMLKLSTNAMINYNTAIYNSDWTYRINDYKANGLNDANDPNNYASVVSREQLTGEEENKRQEEEELNVYVTYRIRVANQSEIYSGTVNQLVDYFDASYELVTKDIVQDISDDDGNIKSTIVAKAPYFTKNDIPQGTLFVAPMEFTDEYSKTIISGTQGTILQTGEYMDLYLTFKVDENNNRAVELGDKHNIVEITSYSTFDQGALSKSPNLVMGMIDRDSEPGNLSVINQVGTLEDDSDIAPTITIGFMGEDIREIRGIVWEDVRTKLLATGQIVGDGVRDAQTEKPINGVTVQLIELVTAKDGKQYEYIWQEMDTGEQASKYVDMLNGTVNDKNIGSVKGLTNLEVGDGEYVFKGYVPGDYIVRFIYGDTKTAQTGVVNVKSYNGQDYKSTAYLGGRDITEWYDLDNKDIINGSLSDARDNENRRLDVIKYSKTMKYSIARVLASQDVGTDNYNANLIDELVNNTYMYADTAKIKVEVEYDTQEMTGKESEEYIDKYKIRNIDFGIEERPTAKIELEKEIEAIKITLADGTVLVDTDAGIKKNVQPSSEIISIYMDEEVMQGANIQIKYKITVTNKSQIDYTGITSESVGTTYYSGKESLTDRLVTTSIDIVADYVDNSLVYRIDDNQDNGWQSMETRFESIAKMETDGYLDPNAKLAEEGINQILINEKLTGIQLAPYESKTLSLVLTKTISSSDETDDLSYTNIAEILQYTNLVGRRADPPGNYDPAEADTDITETIVILPPFGANKAITTYIAIAIAVLALIAGGVIVIKKKLSNK